MKQSAPSIILLVSSLLQRFSSKSRPWTQQFSQLIQGIPPHAYQLAHFLILGTAAVLIGAALRIKMERDYFDDPFNVQFDLTSYAEWVRPFVFPTHKYTIIGFILAAGLISIAAIIYMASLKLIREEKLTIHSLIRLIGSDLVLVVALAVLVWTRNATSTTLLVVCFGAWLLLAVAVLAPTSCLSTFASFGKGRIGCLFLPSAFVVLFLDLTYALLPFVAARIPVMVEYFDVPTTTIMKAQRNGPLVSVDTIQYINKNRLWGNHVLYDPRVFPGQDTPCLPGNEIDVPGGLALDLFVAAHRETFYIHNITRKLCFIGPAKSEHMTELVRLFPESAHHITLVAAQNASVYHKFNNAEQDYAFTQFLSANRLAIVQSIHDLDLTFHHHFQLLNPVHEYDLGRPLREITASYGLNFVLIHKAMSLLGGITYENFLHVVFGFSVVYLLMYMAVVYFALESWRLRVFAVAVYVASIKSLGFIVTFVGVGYVPIRHMLDLATAATLLAYCVGHRKLWLVLACLSSIAGLGLDRLFGIFPLAALVGVLIVRVIHGRSPNRLFELGSAVCSGLVGVTAFFILGDLSAPNPFVSSFVDGVWGFPVGQSKIFLILIVYMLLLVTLIWRLGSERSAQASFALFSLFCAMMCSLYWLTIPNAAHFSAVVPFGALALAGTIASFGSTSTELAWGRRIASGAVVIGAAFWLSSTILMARERVDYTRYSAAHDIYHWSFDRMSLASTADPAIFRDAVQKIDSFSRSGDGIYILSSHDAVLSFLSGRYSRMPYFDMGAYLGNAKLRAEATAVIERDKPRYLFADSCITCTVLTNFPTRASRGMPNVILARINQKINKLQQLQKVFLSISRDYVLKERGALVSIYERVGAE